MIKQQYLLLIAIILFRSFLGAQDIYTQIDDEVSLVNEKVIEWRRHIHANPELSNREFKTAEYVAAHLQSLGLEVRTGIAHTGVIGILRGGKPGPVVGIRADMDALPVLERVDIPYKSTVTSEYNGEEVPVMHACGHDTHVAILMGVAEVLTMLKEEIPGTVVFVFQPAEEGAPKGEEGGAKMMVDEGILEDPKIDIMVGLHISSSMEVGKVGFKPGAAMAAADGFWVEIKGKQTHGSRPWQGVDPIVVSANIIQGFQQIVSRQTNLIKAPVVISVGKIESGVRGNIIPESASMNGTIRTLDRDMRKQVHKAMHRVVQSAAEMSGAEATLEIISSTSVVFNDEELSQILAPTLKQVAGNKNVILMPWRTGAEDFSYFADKIPSFFFYLGGRPSEISAEDAGPHHTPDFFVADTHLDIGVKAFCHMVFDYAASLENK